MTKEPAQPGSEVIDPCMECGISTGTAGSYYSDRSSLAGPDGAVAFLCSDCRSLARAGGKPTIDPLEPRGDLQVAIPIQTLFP
jgi:hypothetical protein